MGIMSDPRFRKKIESLEDQIEDLMDERNNLFEWLETETDKIVTQEVEDRIFEIEFTIDELEAQNGHK